MIKCRTDGFTKEINIAKAEAIRSQYAVANHLAKGIFPWPSSQDAG